MYTQSLRPEGSFNLPQSINNYVYWVLYGTVVTQGRVVCLICTPEARGLRVDISVALGLRVYISGRPRVLVLQLLCNTSFTCYWLHYIYSSTYYFRLWVLIMTFILHFQHIYYCFNISAMQRYSFCRHYKLFTYCIEPLFR